MDVSGHTALVTGGASGLGEATARRLAAAGAHVVVVDRNETLGEDVARAIGGTFWSADVADAVSMETLISTLSDLRVVVNCAGIANAAMTVRKSGPLDLDVFERVLRVNVVGTFNCIRLAAWHMKSLEPLGADGERGIIVNTASIAAFDGVEGGVAYSASKAAVAGMTLPLARDLGRHSIRVMAIAPGSFTTPMTDGMPTDYADVMAASTPFPPRFGQSTEFAALVAHIVENPMLNGEVIRLDGAQRMTPGSLR
jgi:NAD(P)-dependent dehydrogenase (short-subunit alcohol dehydrogenase family)